MCRSRPPTLLAVESGIVALSPVGNGTPTSAAIDVAAQYLLADTDQRAKFILLATDGQPSCTSGMLKDSTQASADAVQSIANALRAGFPTYVLGISTTSMTVTATLNAMATAGGRARSTGNPLDTLFYSAETANDLSAAFQSITGSVTSCIFALDQAPTNPSAAQVSADGTLIQRDSSHANGWDYTSAQSLSIQLFGSACSSLRATTRVTLDANDCG